MNPISLFFWRKFLKRLSVRAALFALFGIGVALLARILSPYVPENFADLVGGRAVDSVLTIIASSMLAVVTFSLSIMVSAYTTAASSATPRATTLLIEDSQAQNALSTFLGAFIYSIVGLVALSTGYYGPQGRVILFFTTALIIAMVVFTIVKWIDQLSNLGRVRQVIARVEEVTAAPLRRRFSHPSLGCTPLLETPRQGFPIRCEATGFVQTINFKNLNDLAKEHGANIFLNVDLGATVHHRRTLAFARSQTGVDEFPHEFAQAIRENFLIGQTRTFEDDPAYGLTILSEIACRALSPAVNDPGTAIDVIITLTRILTQAFVGEKDPDDLKYERVHALLISPFDCLEDSFDAIARDGSRQVEVAIRLQQALAALAELGDAPLTEACRRLARRSLERCKLGMELPEDFSRVEACAVVRG